MDDFQLRFCLFLLLFFNCSLVSAYQRDGPAILTQSDHQVLMSLKHELVDSRGVLSSWNSTGPTPCSAWAGIKCVNGQVIAIQLPWKGLGGRLSDKIGHLKALRRLSLHNNLLVGPVPASLGSLPSLRGVYLFNNRLSGFIPPSIGNCPFLQTFDVSNNRLTGIIPPSLANSTRLYRLNLSFNGLSGLIPASLSQSSSLTFLALQNNNLSGSVPDSWDSLSVNRSYQLRSLALDHNSLSGKIPSSLKKLTMLEELNLSHNKIEGLIPDELGSLSRLNSIDLSNNAINGSLPESFSKLSSLASMNLENNHLDSQIPESISQLRNLSLLNLSANKFEGQIPVFTGNMTFLDLSKNDLTGEIPVSLVNLPNLSSFNVSYNNLSGAVPSSLAKKFNSTSFVGNIQLCGYTGSSPCPSPGPDHNVPSPSQGEINHHRRRKLSTKDIILIAAGSLLIVLLILCCVLFLCFLIRKKAASKTKKGKTGVSASMGVGTKPVAAAGNEPVLGSETGGKLVHFDGPFVFTADDLLCATAETMGKSPYGTAYKATLEDSDHHVAVKRLREKITKAQKEFESEVSALGKIRHPNIVALRAFYLGPKGEKLLVYDYMPNGSLASFLHARGPETSMPWQTRMNIAIGITRGLCFLHTEQNIVHGNLTSSNILLDEHNNPKISEVGLSRLVTSTVSANLIATSGTMGYRAPEFSKLKNANTKTDVFSLGMIMLELLTGKSPSETKDELGLAQWAASTMKEERTSEVFDVELARDASSSNGGDEMLNVLKLALHCVDPSPAARPEAQQVLQKLEEMKPEKGDVTTGPASECR